MLFFLLRRVNFCQLLRLFQIVVIVADVVDERLVFQLQNTGCSLVDKITVVRDIEHRAGVVLDRFFQNLFGNDIQVVCRLVKDQKIGLGEHKTRKGKTSTLAAA